MIKHTKEGLVTDEAQVAVMFLEKAVLRWTKRARKKLLTLVAIREEFFYVGGQYATQITIPWPTVKAAIQPVEGEAFVVVHPMDSGELVPDLITTFRNHWARDTIFCHKRVLNIVTTRAELRELIKHIEEAL